MGCQIALSGVLNILANNYSYIPIILIVMHNYIIYNTTSIVKHPVYSVTSLTGAPITGDREFFFLVSSFSIQMTLANRELTTDTIEYSLSHGIRSYFLINLVAKNYLQLRFH